MSRADKYSLLLLAGGKSKRMGANKAELLYNGKTFVGTLIEKAKQLLIARSCNVEDVAEQCGFSSVYHFCRTFKTRTGMTPTQYSRANSNVGL